MDTRQVAPEQARALDYLRRHGTEAPAAEIRRKVEQTFRDLDDMLAGIPAGTARVRPRPGRWCVQEVADHLAASHRPAVDELASLLRGASPRGGPIPAGLQSAEPLAAEWPEAARQVAQVHRGLADLLSTASDEIPLDARAPVLMVVKARGEDGAPRPLHWTEELDWKAYVTGIRAHILEHMAQIRSILEEVASAGAASPQETR